MINRAILNNRQTQASIASLQMSVWELWFMFLYIYFILQDGQVKRMVTVIVVAQRSCRESGFVMTS